MYILRKVDFEQKLVPCEFYIQILIHRPFAYITLKRLFLCNNLQKMTLVYCKTPDIIPKTFSNSYFFRKKEQIKNKHIRMIAVKKSTNKNKNITK